MRTKALVTVIMCLFMIATAAPALAAIAADDSEPNAASRAGSRDLNGFDQSSTGLPSTGAYVSAAIGRMNADQYPDIVVGKLDWTQDADGLKVYTSKNKGASWEDNSTGIPQTYEYGVIDIADIDLDGDLDIAAPIEGTYADDPLDGIKVYMNNNGSTSLGWSAGPSPVTTGGWESVAFGFINQDQYPDMAAGGLNAGCKVWLNNAGTSWTASSTGLPSTGLTYGVAIGDIDNDGDGDVVCARPAGGTHAYLADNGTSWTESSTGLGTGDQAGDVEIGDIDHDGNLDIATTLMSGMKVYTGNGCPSGTCTWSSESSGLPTAGFGGQIAIGEVNGDNTLDILSGEMYSLGVWLYTSNCTTGTCSWTKWTTDLPTTGAWSASAISDLDLDGDRDLVVGDPGGGTGAVGVRAYLADAYFGPQPPVAAAGLDKQVYAGENVTLNGAGSHDPVGTVTEYDWNVTSKPTGSTAALSAENIVNPVLKTDLPGNYTITLTVKNNINLWSKEDDLVTVTAIPFPNDAPVANAGPDQSVKIGTLVQLNGSASKDDPLGGIATWDWNITTQPAGSAINLSDETVVGPTFTPVIIGVYEFSLAVKDANNTWCKSQDKVKVTAEPQGTARPIAEAGLDVTIELGTKVALNGNASTDDMQIVAYEWKQETGPGTLTIENATKQMAAVTPPAVGSYSISLKVRDNDAYWSDPDLVNIEVIPKNLVPDADISSPEDGDEFLETDNISFDGSNSEDPEEGVITFEWTDSIDGPLGTEPEFVRNLTAGEHTLTLTVTDDHGLKGEVSIDIKVKADKPPTALLSADKAQILKGDSVKFDASDSKDPEGKELRYLFDFGDGGMTPMDTKDLVSHKYAKAGSFDATVTTMDPNGRSAVSEAVTIVVGVVPTAKIALTTASCTLTTACGFDASNSTDEDGTVVSYMFDFGDGKKSEWVTTPAVTHTYAMASTYTVTVKVKDDHGFESTNSATVMVTVKEDAKGGSAGTQSSVGFSFLPIILLIIIVVAVLAAVMMMRKKKGAAAAPPPAQAGPAQVLDPSLGYPGQSPAQPQYTPQYPPPPPPLPPQAQPQPEQQYQYGYDQSQYQSQPQQYQEQQPQEQPQAYDPSQYQYQQPPPSP